MLLALSLGFHILTIVASLRCSENRCEGLKLTDIMSEGYDKGTPPFINGEPAEVEVFASILNIRSVQETTMSFHADIFFHQRWRDDRLIFPENVSSNSIVLDINWRREIWRPDILFKNSLEGKVQDIIIPYMYMKLYNDSSVFFASRLSLQLSCEMDLHRFPHDTQQCDIAIMALIHTVEEMKMRWRNGCGIMVTKNVLLPQFDVINTSCGDCTRKYDIGTFSCLKSTISLQRRTGYYTINIYIPSILIVAMSMLTFWIPPDAVPARITLGVTSLLTIVTKQYQASLPSVSYIVAMNIWMSCCIAFVFCSLLQFALVLWVNRNLKRLPQAIPGPVPDKVVAVHVHSVPTYGRIKMLKKKISLKRIDLDRVARCVFPLAFLCQVVLYWWKFGL